MTKERENAFKQLKTVRGQIEGIIKMIEDGRYCIDICNQIQAATAILKKAEILILEGHIKGCVQQAFASGNADDKIEEITRLLGKAL